MEVLITNVVGQQAWLLNGDRSATIVLATSVVQIEFGAPVIAFAMDALQAPSSYNHYQLPTVGPNSDDSTKNASSGQPIEYAFWNMSADNGRYGAIGFRAEYDGGTLNPFQIVYQYDSWTGITGDPSKPVTRLDVYGNPGATLTVAWRETYELSQA